MYSVVESQSCDTSTVRARTHTHTQTQSQDEREYVPGGREWRIETGE